MKNNFTDLNDYLFEQLERLNDDSLTQEELDRELKISKQVVNVSQTIINNADLLLKANKYYESIGCTNNEVAPLLRLRGGEEINNEKDIQYRT